MIKSMTGFARSETQTDAGLLVWELRSVNHRYLEVNLRLPEVVRAIEPALRKQVEAVVGRGKLDATLRLESADGQGPALALDPDMADALARAVGDLAARLPEARPPSLGELMQWPGLLRRPAPDPEALQASARRGLEAALTELREYRQREGERTQVMLEERCRSVEELVARARVRVPQVLASLRERYRSRLAELDIQADESRLEQELALVAQKLDVDEELDRLESHVAEMRDALGREEPVGRRLDFLMQEFNREANTLGSKSQDSETTAISVELKVAIEQMREQIQNVE
ncbi:YicC/YloC family endoribonuclease [Natronospira bacteriovora]|uniref:YicC/YloC family endoribonuclease n=1 Tax=Natronospira bacteriovora TaxID=3069753 RepID=A0ABU0W8F5_9GAMM|nr:YicC/YloC family endoribonuclease [Natronospira sp. AB-CW4]MDQ2070193.1 YicC/YloC family endoribonuclease [Natronospira sp. AB-CW4]